MTTLRQAFTASTASLCLVTFAQAAPTFSTDAGGGVTSDLFDVSQGAVVVQTTPVIPIAGEDIREAFGTVAGVEGGNTIFTDGPGLGSTDTVFWQSAGFVNLSSIELRFGGIDVLTLHHVV